MLEPHPRNTCGIVKARQFSQATQTPEPGVSIKNEPARG